MAIYKWTTKSVNGERQNEQVKVKPREAKAYIMKVNGWTAEEYRKHYDIFKNKLRAYESFKRSRGISVEPQSVVEILYKQASAKKREGTDYKPSQKMQQIEQFSAVSITKGRQLAQSNERYQRKVEERYEAYIKTRFGDVESGTGLIAKNKQAQKIAEEITDPVKREQALADFADKLHEQMKESKKTAEGEAISSGETFGSNDEIDFDIEQYL